MIGFIVNPVSANGKGAAVWRSVERLLQNRNIPYIVRFTDGPRQGAALARELAEHERVSVVAAVGGDGTVHEAANGLFAERSGKPLGFIPAGSGNDFARGHGIPADPEAALDLLLNAEAVRRIDVIRIGGRIAVASAGAGLDGRVARVTNEAAYKDWLNRMKLGRAAYVLSLLRVLASYRTGNATIIVDGRSHAFRSVWLIAAANTPTYGGGMRICPGADPTDGEAALCVVSNLSRFELIRVFHRVYRGTHVELPSVSLLSGRRVEIHTDGKLDLHMDGEAGDTTPCTLEVLPGALAVIAAPDAADAGRNNARKATTSTGSLAADAETSARAIR